MRPGLGIAQDRVLPCARPMPQFDPRQPDANTRFFPLGKAPCLNKTFSAWLDELAGESEPEMWCISKGAVGEEEPSVAEWVEFVKQAFAVRDGMTPQGEVWTSYLWHDAQASQLRFASSPCDPGNLPFGAVVELIDGPEVIIASWLNSDDHIPWDDLEEVEVRLPDPADDSTVRVWAWPHGLRR